MQKHRNKRVLLPLIVFIQMSAATPYLQAGALQLNSSTDSESVVRHTLVDRRFDKVVRQQMDYSCGAATLATLMTYYFNDKTSEQQILKLLVSGLSAEEIASRENEGFSLLDLKRAAEERRYRAAGYRLTLDQLEKLTAPVIVHVSPKGYEHFALLRMVVGDRVFLADPSRGNFRMSLQRFQEEWDGVVFMIEKTRPVSVRNEAFGKLNPRDRLVDRTRWSRQIERSTLF